MSMIAGLVADGGVSVTPTDNAPAYAAFTSLIGGLLAYAGLAAVAAVVLGGAGWALGERIGMDRMSLVGKMGVFTGLGLALLTGCCVSLVNFMITSGASVK